MPLTLSSDSSNFVRSVSLVVTLAFSQTALAQGEDLVDKEATDATAGPELLEQDVSPEPKEQEKVAPAPLPQVRITTVGYELPPRTLESMLGPALQSSFDLHFHSSQEFKLQELFQTRTDSPAGVHIWVDTTAPHSARIYFANRDGTRYLVRDLERSTPMTEMDREAIAQAMEWSLQALSEGTAGMSRAEVEELLTEPEAEELEPLELEVPEPDTSWRRKEDGWLPHVALLHRWSPYSADLLATQGPALRLGIDRLIPEHQFGLAAGVHYQYPQRHAEEGVALELQTLGARLDARYLATGVWQGSGLGVHLGAGFDVLFSSPEVLDLVKFEAAEKNQNLIPMLGAGLIWQVHVEASVRLEVELGVEVDLRDVSYDIVTATETRTLVSRWPVRPAVSIGIELF